MRSLLLLPLLSVALATGVAAQSPVLEPVLTLPGDLAPSEAGGVQKVPYLNSGGAGSLAVWIDHRAEHHSPLAGEGGPDVYGMRLDAAGQPLDQVALRMPFAVGDKLYAKAAWNGTAWLVTWENQQPLSSSSHSRLILGARVAADGTVLDAEPIVIKDDEYSTGLTTAVASDGNGWVVVAQGTELDSGRIVGVRVAADGTVLNPGGTKIVDMPWVIGAPDMEYANGTYLLAWGASPVQGIRISSATLAPLGGVFAIGVGSSSQPRIATNGTEFLVAWQTTDLGACVRARRVSTAGAQSAVIQVTPLSNGEYNWQPDVAWSGDTWHVAFRDDDDDVYRDARIAANLTLLDFDGVPLPFGDANGGRITIAGAGDGVTAAFERWEFTQPWPGAIHVANVDDALVPGTPVALSLSATRHGFPALAAGPAQYLVAFQGEEQATVTIEIQRLDPFGAALDPEPIEVDAGIRRGKPAVAWNGSVYLVVWEDLVNVTFETDDLVKGIRVAPDGTLLDPAPFVVMEGAMPAVAAQGDTFLVVASDAPSTPELRYTFAQRVAGDGTPVGGAEQVGGNFSRYPAVAPHGEGWVVLWQRNFSHDNPNSVVDGALVDALGKPSPTFSVDGAPGFGGAARPAVASSGDNAMLVWMDDSTGLAARTLNAFGALGAPFQVAALPALPADPAIAWNGVEYVVAWTEWRAQVGLWDFRTDVYATRLTVNGLLLDAADGFPVAAGQETELHPMVAGALGSSLLGFVAHLPDAPHATLRVRARRESDWATAGGGVGAPVLQGQGALVPATTATLHLSGAAPAAPGGHVLGVTALGLPLFGGVLVPAPHALVPFTTSGAGAVTTPVPVPSTMPSGLTVYAQSWLLDPAAPAGVAGSNAVVSIAQ
jgi:hypothetical protein